eukprot:6188518-Pleurochrysis_carterae.AAC.1
MRCTARRRRAHSHLTIAGASILLLSLSSHLFPLLVPKRSVSPDPRTLASDRLTLRSAWAGSAGSDWAALDARRHLDGRSHRRTAARPADARTASASPHACTAARSCVRVGTRFSVSPQAHTTPRVRIAFGVLACISLSFPRKTNQGCLSGAGAPPGVIATVIGDDGTEAVLPPLFLLATFLYVGLFAATWGGGAWVCACELVPLRWHAQGERTGKALAVCRS